MKTGILGGTFNPIHLAHLRIAEEVREACALDRVLFIPAATPPHKPLEGEVAFDHRLAMVRAAIADNPAFAASDVENRRSGKSFSVDTLEILHREYPGDEFFFIMGMDSFVEIASWYEYPRLFGLCHIVVTARPGSRGGSPGELLPVAVADEFCYDGASRRLLHHSGFSVIFLEETFLDISSTRIRQLVAAGRSVRYLIPAAVEDYLHHHALYWGHARS
ncbi:nicotinate-nucleotide adenylyltransferase [Geoalkalibacter halelectricus]|uniref:Probable nicotinate-nucleotide adenylyltransferase n=1 Tax=Geoalkalibacter halelectricus TaxID=2847045 RepID=A0ABY5ZMY7_9BACT|nr:nicotinate-nucleotide adenylyltransferase [Geoalkalibacter halelectricus]MDO3378591.1 nicotinate-nucleotide adenylyltransferase [Geoalkalibacter halelectricus]UWZ80096.1 nicotinate-nucleotide adenylyltransferase [Geoalkalibacter halelectricus]